MRSFDITIRSDFRVEVDETKFTPEFFAEFSRYMWAMDSVEEAVAHLADLFARGMIRGDRNEFIEGYGPAAEMGIRFIVERASPMPSAVDLTMQVDVSEIKLKEVV